MEGCAHLMGKVNFGIICVHVKYLCFSISAANRQINFSLNLPLGRFSLSVATATGTKRAGDFKDKSIAIIAKKKKMFLKELDILF